MCLHDERGISAKEGPRGLPDGEVPGRQPSVRERETGGPGDAGERERCAVHPGAGWGRDETHRERGIAEGDEKDQCAGQHEPWVTSGFRRPCKSAS